MENPYLIVKLASANNCNDVVAILQDGSVRLCTKHYGVGMSISVGMNWQDVEAEYPAAVERAKIARAKMAPLSE
jgi:hypothetical protein